jgi:RHS repeat-associated protein
MRRLSFVLMVAAAFILPETAAAQFEAPPEIHIVAPLNGATRHSLNPKIRVEYGMGGCLDDGNGGCNPDLGTLLIKKGSTDITSSFTATEWYAENGTGAYGNVNLTVNSWNTLYAEICNNYELCADTTISVYITSDPQPSVIIGAHNPSMYDPGACAAVPAVPGGAFACEALVLSHGIPGYVSLDALRSTGVVYSTRSAMSQITVPLSLSLVWDNAATSVRVWLNGGDTTKYWNPSDWGGASSGSVTRRIALSRAESTQAGGYIGRQIIKVRARIQTAQGYYEDSMKLDTIPFYFERDSLTTPIARGWGIAGMARIYKGSGHAPNTSGPTGDVLLVQSGGGIAYYKHVSTSADTLKYGRPAGMFATLVRLPDSLRFVMLAMDGTKNYFKWVTALGFARLDSVETPVGKTVIAYRDTAPGFPETITDPKGKQIKFFYDGLGLGSLDSICSPAGADQRCTSFTYGTSGGNTVLVKITTPDGGKDTLTYSGSPHWSLLTGFKPRGRDSYTITYHDGIARPAGVIQPSSSDTLKYLAPQLAGATITTATSGSPAPSAIGDSAWGWVRPPLGPTSYFTADWLGNTVLSKGPNNKVGKVARNSAGQPTLSAFDGQNLMHWTYNAMGAVTTIRTEGADTTKLTYLGDCGSGTGYPCQLSQQVVKNTPLPPDTTILHYGGDLLVDSVYRSNGPALGNSGVSRTWYGANARVDSTLDAQGHRRKFSYEGTWGNLSMARSDSILGKCPIMSCQQVIDTTVFGHDALNGRVEWTRRGNAGLKVTTFRDRVARDTMAVAGVDTSGAPKDTTRTRINVASRTVTVIDAKGNSIEFLSDGRGRMVRQTDPASAKDTFAYDGNDRLIKWKTRRGDSLMYTYDSLSRVRTKVLSGTGGGTWTYGYHGTYSTLDTLLGPADSLYRVRNSKGWMTEEKTRVNAVTRTVKYGYNQSGSLDTLKNPWNETYLYGWDAANRARTVTNPWSETFSIRHSTEGLVTSIVFPTGTDQLSYDASHRVKSAGLSGEVTYTRDTVTKGLASIKRAGVTQSFTYDHLGRLASEAVDSAGYGPSSEAYTYDKAGNRSGTGYSYDNRNAALLRPKIAGDTVFSPGDSIVYDATGNPVSWTNRATRQLDSLFWNAENQLIRLRRRDTAGGNVQLDVEYGYDGMGRRIKQVGIGVPDRYYVWNGWDLLAQTDSNGNPVTKYTFYPHGIDLPLAMRKDTTTTLFHLDGQGNVYLLTEKVMGSRRSEYRFRAWGDRYNAMTENVASPLTYKAREGDRETGLVYMRNRYYSSRLERFLNQDPLGTAPTYGFAFNDPVNLSDPSGLFPFLGLILAVLGAVHDHSNFYCANGGTYDIDFDQCWGWDGRMRDTDDPSGMAPHGAFHSSIFTDLAESVGKLLYGSTVLGSFSDNGVDVTIYRADRNMGEWDGKAMGNAMWIRETDDIHFNMRTIAHEYVHIQQQQSGAVWMWLHYGAQSLLGGYCNNSYEIEAYLKTQTSWTCGGTTYVR